MNIMKYTSIFYYFLRLAFLRFSSAKPNQLQSATLDYRNFYKK